jgi:hypothetical protein
METLELGFGRCAQIHWQDAGWYAPNRIGSVEHWWMVDSERGEPGLGTPRYFAAEAEFAILVQ